MPEDEQIELIDAHPRLGAPPASVSALSHREQGYDRDTTEAIAELDRLNAGLRGQVRVPFLRVRRRPIPRGARAGPRGRADRGSRRGDPPGARRRRRDRPRSGAASRSRGGRGMTELGPNRYGKSAIRLVKVDRDGRRPSRPGPDGRDLARGRLRGLVRRRRQLARRRDRHDEEHDLRARRRAPDRLDRGVRDRPRPALPARPAGRPGDGLDRGVRVAARSATRPMRSSATGRGRGRASWPRPATG